jgi:threonine synthase
VLKAGDKVNICVPTGNFGNILAAYYAGEMGIPVNRFICASNKNRVLTDFFDTGVYSTKREFYLTNSPSMDILISSNLERLLYHLAGNDGREISRLMESLEKEQVYRVSPKIREGLKKFWGGTATVEETNATIGAMYREEKYLIDTHTAVGYKVYRDYVEATGDDTPTLIASTASAYKFAESVAKSIGLPNEANGFRYVDAVARETGVRVPKALKDLDKRKIRHTGVIAIPDMISVVENSVK